MSLDFVAIDWETANRYRSSPIQVGLAVVRGGVVTETFGSLLRPPRLFSRFDPDCVAIHGILPPDIADKPTFLELWPAVERRIAGLPLVAHNAAFDIPVIRETMRVCGQLPPTIDFACSLVLARRHCALHRFSLDLVAADLGVALTRHHDATSDALACAGVTLGLAARVGATSLADLLAISGVEWGRLTPESYEPCRDIPVVVEPEFEEATLF